MSSRGILITRLDREEPHVAVHDYVFSLTYRPRKLSSQQRFVFHPSLRGFFNAVRYEHLNERKSIDSLYSSFPLAGFPRRTFGYATIKIDRNKRMITWQYFYPFDFFKARHKNRFSRMGVASLVQLEIARHLALRYPHYSVRHSYTLSRERTSQLAALGINASTKYSVKEYLEQLERTVPSRIKFPSHK